MIQFLLSIGLILVRVTTLCFDTCGPHPSTLLTNITSVFRYVQGSKISKTYIQLSFCVYEVLSSAHRMHMFHHCNIGTTDAQLSFCMYDTVVTIVNAQVSSGMYKVLTSEQQIHTVILYVWYCHQHSECLKYFTDSGKYDNFEIRAFIYTK